MGAKMYKNSFGTGVPDVLTFSLNLPVEDPFDFKSGGIEENRSYRTYGFGGGSDENPVALACADRR
jgi:hypothetical protein